MYFASNSLLSVLSFLFSEWDQIGIHKFLIFGRFQHWNIHQFSLTEIFNRYDYSGYLFLLGCGWNVMFFKEFLHIIWQISGYRGFFGIFISLMSIGSVMIFPNSLLMLICILFFYLVGDLLTLFISKNRFYFHWFFYKIILILLVWDLICHSSCSDFNRSLD